MRKFSFTSKRKKRGRPKRTGAERARTAAQRTAARRARSKEQLDFVSIELPKPLAAQLREHARRCSLTLSAMTAALLARALDPCD
jgi:hypothetical protein